MVKCPICRKQFPSHHGLGGHLSGPCGLTLKEKKAFGKSKPKSKQKPLKDLKTSVERKLNGSVKKSLDDALKTIRAISQEHRAKASELDKLARRLEALK